MILNENTVEAKLKDLDLRGAEKKLQLNKL